MKKLSLKAVAVAAGLLVSGSVFAAVTTVVDFDATSPTVNKFAKELAYNDAAPLAAAAPANGLNFTTKIGFGVSNGQTRYIRIDYGNATLDAAHAAVVGTDMDIGGTVAVVQGGQIGDSYVIYQVTATADLAATAPVNVLVPALRITSTGSAVTATYALHETAVSAVAGATGTGLLYSKTANVATFATGLAFSLATNSTTASVEASFKQFTAATAVTGTSNKGAKIGTITYGAAAGVKKNDGTAVALTDLVANGTELVVTGDFTAAAGANTAAKLTNVFLAGGINCAAGTGATEFVGSQAGASFTIDTGSIGGVDLCYLVNGTSSIPAESYTAAVNVTPATGTSTANLSAAALGSIVRDGTELQAPWFSTAGGYISRFVLTSTHTSDAAYTASVLTEDGNTCATGAGATGTIMAGKQLVVAASDICSSFSTANSRAAVIFTIAAPNSKIQGTYNIVNPTTGSVSVSGMVRPGTN